MFSTVEGLVTHGYVSVLINFLRHFITVKIIRQVICFLSSMRNLNFAFVLVYWVNMELGEKEMATHSSTLA